MSKTLVKYEEAFAQYFKSTRAFSFWKGRVALYAILKAMDVSPEDEIILPGYTCVMDVNPIKYLQAKPVYVDIEPVTFNIDVSRIEDKITTRTKVIIAQHTYGYPCEMDAIMSVAARHDIPVVEDCCLALGSQYRGRAVGTIGKAGYFSFQWNKPYTTGLGGMVLTDDSKLARQIEFLCEQEACEPTKKETLMLEAQLAIYRAFIYPRTTALAQSIFRFLTRKGLVVGSSASSEYKPVMAEDFFKRLGGFQARSGLGQFSKIETNIAHRQGMARLYDQLLREKGWQGRKYDASVLAPVMVRYPVRIREKDRALAEAAGAGVELGSWFECPLHPMETPLAVYDYQAGMCPVAEKAALEVVNLPLHLRATEKTARRTVEFISQFTEAD